MHIMVRRVEYRQILLLHSDHYKVQHDGQDLFLSKMRKQHQRLISFRYLLFRIDRTCFEKTEDNPLLCG